MAKMKNQTLTVTPYKVQYNEKYRGEKHDEGGDVRIPS